MNIDKGRLYYATGIDNSQLRSDATESKNILASIGQSATQEGNRIDAAFGKIAKAAGGFFALSQAKEFAQEIIRVRGEIESLETSFRTLAGTKGDALFGEIRQFAVSTPMMMKDLAAGAQTMLAFNIEAEKVMPILRAIGDISMGNAQKFNSLTLAFSQMSATGKLMGQDLLQMINAGFNPLSVISEKTGKSIGELKEEMEKGRITTDMVTDAFISAASAGGKFSGMLEKQSKGINGAISNLQGAIEDFYNDMGKASQGPVVDAINSATNLVKNYQTVAEILGVVIATYGVYKAAVITNEAMIQAASSTKSMAIKEAIDSEMAALTALIPQKEAEAQTSLQQAVAAGHITREKAAEVAALRAEAQAQLTALATAEAAAKARLVASQTDIQTSLKWEEEIHNKISALEEEAEALFENGESIAFDAKQEEIAALKSELLEVQKEREAAVEVANTAATEMNAVSHQQNAIATTEDSTATAINTAQTATNTGVTSALTIAKTHLTKVTQALYATLSAHPYAIAAAAVVALSYGVYKLATYETELERGQKALRKAFDDSQSSISSERIQIDVMFDRLRKAKEGTDDYKNAKQAIIDQYGNYLQGLSNEVSSLQDVEAAYNAVTAAAEKSARARAMNSYIDEQGDDYAQNRAKQFDAIRKAIADVKGEDFAKAMESYINDVIDGTKKWSDKFLAEFDKTIVTSNGTAGTSTSYTENRLQILTDQAQQSKKTYEELVRDAMTKFGVSSTEAEQTAEDKNPKTKNKAYWEKLKKDAESELATLTSVEAAGKKGAELRAKIASYDKMISTLYSVSSKSGTDVKQQNDNLLANEAANRRKQAEQYARQLKDQARDSELEISQAHIDAMEEGIDKELAQNKLNYDRLEEQNKRRQRDMLDNLADAQIRSLEDSNPTIFKHKTKDGKLEETPGARYEKYREIRAKLTIEDLDPEQQAQLEEFGRTATEAFDKANKQSMKTMLDDILDYEQQRQTIAEEYKKRRDSLYAKDGDGKTKTDKDGNPVLREGVSQGNIDELNRQEEEALKSIDEQFASREVAYQAWCEQIADLSLRQLNAVLEQAQKELDELKAQNPNDPKLAQARAKVATAQNAVDKAKAKDDLTPGKRTIKEWEDLYKTLNDVRGSFEEIGEAVGGTVGKIISQCGQFAASTLSMINGIVQLVNMSRVGMETAGKEGATAISTMEKASVILTIISAAIQLATQIASLFNDDEAKEKEIEHLQTRIDQLQWELDNADIMRVNKTLGTSLQLLNDSLVAANKELMRVNGFMLRFGSLANTAAKDQELLALAAGKMANAYANVAYSADKALGESRYKGTLEELNNITQQQILIQSQIDKERSKKDTDNSRIRDWEQKIAELGQQAIEVINDIVEDIMGDTATGIAEQLGDAFFDAFQAGEDAAEAWGNKVNEIVADILKKMLVQKFLEEPLGQIFDVYKNKWFKDGEFRGINAVIASMTDLTNDLNKVGEYFTSVWTGLSDTIKDMVDLTDNDPRTGSQGGIATANQDSVDELNGRATAIQGHTFSISENTKLLVANTNAILQSVMNIESETAGLGQRLNAMSNDIKDMTNSLDDIANKGIRLK